VPSANDQAVALGPAAQIAHPYINAVFVTVLQAMPCRPDALHLTRRAARASPGPRDLGNCVGSLKRGEVELLLKDGPQGINAEPCHAVVEGME